MKLDKVWWVWIGVLVLMSAFLTYRLVGKDEGKGMFLIGKMTSGHAQFGVKCSSCHLKSFEGMAALQKACLNCHEQELKRADDSHPESKFTDPRNADRVAKLDARFCVTCHTEHRPKSTHAMGVTLSPDFCVNCHEDIAEDRKSHAGLGFNTCQSAGCHNFHDNRALYEDFLVKHAHEKPNSDNPRVLPRNFMKHYKALFANKKKFSAEPIAVGKEDIPGTLKATVKVPDQWHATAHAKAGVNCSACHVGKKGDQSWLAKPTHQVCATCHVQEHKTLLQGKHGIRLGLKLSPMTPGMSSLPMKKKASHKTLNCNSCHKAHDRDTKFAAVKACMSCHNSEHTNAYLKSPHYQLWKKELANKSPANSGVSCATCHMPRRKIQVGDDKFVWVEHNQNDNLRPNEKMIRSVCANCHGLRFSINALADKKLVNTNFSGKPTVDIKSIDWSLKRLKNKKGKHSNKSK